MKRSISRILRWVFRGAPDTMIEDQIRRNAEALEMKRLAAGSLPV